MRTIAIVAISSLMYVAFADAKPKAHTANVEPGFRGAEALSVTPPSGMVRNPGACGQDRAEPVLVPGAGFVGYTCFGQQQFGS